MNEEKIKQWKEKGYIIYDGIANNIIDNNLEIYSPDENKKFNKLVVPDLGSPVIKIWN